MKSDKDTANPTATAMVRNTLTLRPGSALISFKTGFESLLSAVLVIAKPLILTVISVSCRARLDLGGILIQLSAPPLRSRRLGVNLLLRINRRRDAENTAQRSHNQQPCPM